MSQKQDVDQNVAQDEQEEQYEEIPEGKQQAFSNGWQELDDWIASGKDEDDWIDYKHFNQNGAFIGQIRKLKAENAKLQKGYANLKTGVTNMSKVFLGTLSQASQNQVNHLQAQRDAAAEDNDIRTYNALTKQLEALQQKTQEETEALEEQFALEEDEELTPEQRVQAFYEDWKQDNQWHGVDPVMTEAANKALAAAQKANPNVTYDEAFEKARKAAMAAKRPATKRASDTNTGGRKTTTKPTKKLTSLPQELQELARTSMSITGQTEEQFMERWSALKAAEDRDEVPHFVIPL